MYMSCLQTARSEWARYAEKLNGAKTVRWVLKERPEMAEGYSIMTRGDVAEISGSEKGLLHGTFELISCCRRAGNAWTDVNKTETPAFPLRMLWSWSRLGNTYRHSPYMKLPSVMKAETLTKPEGDPEMMRFIRHMAAMKVNALAVTHELHHGDLDRYDQHGFRPFYGALRKFTEYLKGWGIDVYLYTAAMPERAWRLENGNTDCPFNPKVRDFTDDFIDEIFRELPQAAGLLMAGGLGGYAGGNLHECSCRYCEGATPEERVYEQIFAIADRLKRHGKNLVYTVTTDIPFTMGREVHAVLSLIDRVPDNVSLTFKNCFHDYEELRYPEHPLLGRLEGIEKFGVLPIAVEMQLFPEMRGKGLILSNVTEIWCRQFKLLNKLKAGGVIGVIQTHPDDAHPSMAEWYAWGELSWNPCKGAREILEGWAKMEYPPGVHHILPDVLLASYTAASNTVYAGGMQCGIHGMICPFPHYIKHKMNDTWCRKNQPADFGVLGVSDEPFGLYDERLQAEILSNPRLFLLTGAHAVDENVVKQLLAEKDAAVAQYTAMLATWQTAEGLFEPGDYRFEQTKTMLMRNIVDARRFRECHALFLDWQAGRLTPEDIENAKSRLITEEDCSINTCNALVERFLYHLDLTVRDIPFDTKFDNMSDLPQLEGKCWQEGNWNTE